MKDLPASTPYYVKPAYRLLSGLFGVFLMGVGGYALLFADPLTALHFALGAGMVLFGSNMLLSACTAKESWLSGIGPLP